MPGTYTTMVDTASAPQCTPSAVAAMMRGLKEASASRGDLACVAAAVLRTAMHLDTQKATDYPVCASQDPPPDMGPTVVMSVPLALCSQIHSQIENMTLHAQNNKISRQTHHRAIDAARAVTGVKSEEYVRDCMRMNRIAARDRHFQHRAGVWRPKYAETDRKHKELQQRIDAANCIRRCWSAYRYRSQQTARQGGPPAPPGTPGTGPCSRPAAGKKRRPRTKKLEHSAEPPPVDPALANSPGETGVAAVSAPDAAPPAWLSDLQAATQQIFESLHAAVSLGRPLPANAQAESEAFHTQFMTLFKRVRVVAKLDQAQPGLGLAQLDKLRLEAATLLTSAAALRARLARVPARAASACPASAATAQPPEGVAAYWRWKRRCASAERSPFQSNSNPSGAHIGRKRGSDHKRVFNMNRLQGASAVPRISTDCSARSC